MNPQIRDWHGKRIWIIGASTGIGAEVARQLLEQGALVALSARNQQQLSQIAQSYPHALTLPLDITDHPSVQAAHDQLLQHWGQFDLVLVVAGTYNAMRATSFNLADANHVLDVNVRGVYQCLAVILPTLLRQGAGGIGIVGSVAGFSGLPEALAYGPSKAAVVNLCESLYLDLRPRNIAVYMINPGFVATPMTANNDFRMPALMTAAAAAQVLIKGMEQGQFHIHFPKRFTNWLRLARLLPYRSYFYLVHKITGL
ncbi:SDR family NAD(P)-dependent oxidoreductase [Undibacterium oligocarboniphilum]|uniref:SDR family NAD(P)-dependent oxidoreductase n=1 Tax=Undibacterium oligocarboniphilum TaxID=666702 RepID=A0A850QAQ7_9BURK|nr:SDR family NAD(P)-dependent oxidoreductase [Undibacterium oligocarboniphilum]MBC3871008.1 SDR family NAD(P)-dependent oxidoreductase [Undibacterium oligocarboniphilum]NVO76369.1 SDR family NAD(P)-dependent oxidoreductase [Undibacterium oligocarboniphilum]